MSNWVAEEHGMWHAENGPSGPYGVACPWDACGWAFADDAEQEYLAAQEAAEVVAAAPALREGEEPAGKSWAAYGPETAPLPDPWMEPFAFDPPF